MDLSGFTALLGEKCAAMLLEDARASVVKAMEKDSDKHTPCRNTAVILVVGGKERAFMRPPQDVRRAPGWARGASRP